MILNIIFAIAMYPIIFIMYIVMKQEGKRRGKLIFGCTVNSLMEDEHKEELDGIIMQYRKSLLWMTIVLAIIPAFTFFIPYTSISYTIWMIWLLVVCFFYVVPFYTGNKAVKKIKDLYTKDIDISKEKVNDINTNDIKSKDKDVDVDLGGTTQCVDLKSIENSRRVKLYHFLPQMIVSALLIVAQIFIHKDATFVTSMCLTITFTLCTLLFWIIAVYMDHQKTQVINSNSDINLNYSRAKKNLWKNLWVICSWLNTLYVVCIWAVCMFMINAGGIALIISIVESMVIFIICIVICLKLYKLRDMYYEQFEEEYLQDDDSHWLLGMIYYNKNDKHLMVEKRVGFGTTMNMARPASVWMMVICAVLILVIPITGVWMMFSEFTPINLRIDDDILIASQLKDDYQIDVEDIENVELLDEMPMISDKISGTGMDKLDKGTFYLKNEGVCELFINPENDVFIRFEADDQVYYMTGVDDNQTKDIYEKIK